MSDFSQKIVSLAFSIRAQWFSPPGAEQQRDAYWEIRRTFDWVGSGDCVLEIAADARYAAWLNGVFVGAGPYPDWPQTRSVDRWKLDGLLHEGRNELVVLLHRIGKGTFSHVPGETGVAFAVVAGNEVVAASGPDCEWRVSPHYQSGQMPRITAQLGFGFAYDAAAPDACWLPVEKADCKSIDATGRSFRPRPIPPCELHERLPAHVVTQGFFQRAENPTLQPLAWRMQRDWLSFREAGEVFSQHVGVPHDFAKGPLSFADPENACDGVWVVIDLEREATGFLELETTAEHPALLEIAWGQHLDDGRVRAQVGQRYFASSYRCRSGHQIFREPLTRIGCRYLQIQISGQAAGLKLHYAGLRESLYPIPEPKPCPSADSLDQAIYDLCVRTLHVCMGDHYDDTPWREQGLYANDALNQSLAGYAALGEIKYPQASFDLLGGGLREDGFLELCAPAKVPITIPAFTFAWVLGVWRNIDFSKDFAFARQQWPRIEAILNKAEARVSNGLLASPCGPEYWHFYDWTAGGLDGTVEGDATRFACLEHTRFDAALNAFFILALRAGAKMAGHLQETREANQWFALSDSLGNAMRKTFWDEASSTFHSFHTPEFSSLHLPPCELVQALALLADCCPEEHEAALRDRLLDPQSAGWIAASLSQSLHTFEALLPHPELHSALRQRIRRTWGAMLASGATACWETEDGGWAFDRAGSLCHGWSAIPAYVFHKMQSCQASWSRHR